MWRVKILSVKITVVPDLYVWLLDNNVRYNITSATSEQAEQKLTMKRQIAQKQNNLRNKNRYIKNHLSSLCVIGRSRALQDSPDASWNPRQTSAASNPSTECRACADSPRGCDFLPRSKQTPDSSQPLSQPHLSSRTTRESTLWFDQFHTISKQCN